MLAQAAHLSNAAITWPCITPLLTLAGPTFPQSSVAWITIMRMTEAALRQLCRKHELYVTPSLNEVLYCNFQGFTEIAGLEGYTALRSLFLEGNALDQLEGLPPSELTCL